jgi:hypothetical protein
MQGAWPTRQVSPSDCSFRAMSSVRGAMASTYDGSLQPISTSPNPPAAIYSSVASSPCSGLRQVDNA